MAKVVLATASYDKTIRFWEAPSNTCYRTIPYADSQVNAMEIDPDRQFLAVAGNPQVKFFEINSPSPNPVTTFEGHSTNVTSLGFHKNGNWMYTGSEDGGVRIWDLRASGYQTVCDIGAAVNSVRLHPNQCDLIVGLQNGSVVLWNLKENRALQVHVPVKDSDYAILSVAISPDMTRAVAVNKLGRLFVYDLGSSEVPSLQLIQTVDAHKTYILKVGFTPDGKSIVTASADRTLKIWNARDYKLIKPLLGHARWVWDFAFSADSAYMVSASSDMMARLWDLNQGETIRHYQGHQKVVNCVALSDGA